MGFISVRAALVVSALLLAGCTDASIDDFSPKAEKQLPAKLVQQMRAKGMTVVDNPDKSKFVAALAPVNAEFEKQFGKATLDKIRDVK